MSHRLLRWVLQSLQPNVELLCVAALATVATTVESHTFDGIPHDGLVEAIAELLERD
ncbi:hypothetical protein MDOR_01150 [Mycolicibacterium doricum]|uniref:Uncharacterized protein n=1 Tax=Mycolicibacterium doricum TaxID=126673 RepID=A0A7I7VKV6_9MYCO|nr:hypothetical protein [Mycolicibacterium doricum]MCV7267708.1 hypothetical protein [Mycolicibacterium doricum]BBZ05946.1 hypothetical protein MDOR_01150 [Mycolicibacterium doricum]